MSSTPRARPAPDTPPVPDRAEDVETSWRGVADAKRRATMAAATLPLELPSAPAERANAVCAHCGTRLSEVAGDAYCCDGCRVVARLIAAGGLDRYYDLGGARGAPVELVSPARDRQWLERAATELDAATTPTRLELDVQGMHCAGCVWLASELFARAPRGIAIVANPALGRLVLRVEPGFELVRFVDDVESFGYRLGPPLKTSSRARDGLLIRTGIAIGLAANAMMFAVAMYLGLHDGPLFEVMRTLEVVLAIAAVAVGAPVFLRGAIAGLRRGMLHLDLPIALGMLLALTGTVVSFALGGDAAYADTVAVFVALMLLGRWLQARAITRNRDRLLRSTGADGVLARRVVGGSLAVVRADEIALGDRLVIAPGEIAVVDAELESDACVSLDWISGESEQRELSRGERVDAGAVNAGVSAIVARALTGWERSGLDALLGRPSAERDERAPSVLWDRVVRVYVLLVLASASLAAAAWLLFTGDALRALDVATAVLVVTCPCGIGIATPLAYELATSALRRRGLFVRRERALDRAADVERVVFDKTGTLTTGHLEVSDPAVLEALSAADRDALATLVARSAHPKSDAVRRALATLGEIAWRDDVLTVEEPGRGVRATIEGREVRLGTPGWAGPASAGDLALAIDGRAIAAIATREVLRADAAHEVSELRASGLDVRILSGDDPARVDVVATRIGIPSESATGGCSPADKADWLLAHHDRTTLFVGDGINDGPAFDAADLAGTPSIDRPHLPGRSDFFFVTAGLAPIRALLDASRAVRRVAKRNLGIAIAYNALAVSLAAAGLMQPWLAAILMPASSLLVIAATVRSLREERWMTPARRPRWRS